MMQGQHQGTKQVLDTLGPQSDLTPDQRQPLFAGILEARSAHS